MDDVNTTPQGVIRRAGPTQRARMEAMEAELRRLREELEATKTEATALATYIQRRGGASVWDHSDVMQIMQDSVVNICANVLRKAAESERKGLPATYAGFREIVVTQFERSRASVIDRVGHPEERGATHSPELVSDRMKVDLRNVFRLPNVA